MYSQTSRRPPRLLLLELNEINPTLLEEASARLRLVNFPKLLAMRHSATSTADTLEHQGLDPWVQWVGIHSGRPTSTHGVRRLGDTRSQHDDQIWHVLAAAGYTWGVFGAMNAPRGDTTGCAFFVPDPWSWDEQAYPHSLEALLALPRYVSKNYLDVDRGKALANLLRSATYFLPPATWGIALRFARRAVAGVSKNGTSVHTLTTLFDYLSTLIFVQLCRRSRPDFALLFLNNIAHLQHQFWLSGDDIHPEMELGLRLTDHILGILFEEVASADSALVVANAFRQVNVHGKGFYGYRQRNPVLALAALGVHGARVEQCMTHDAHIFFESAELADRAETRLRDCRLASGENAFYVDRLDATHIFYQITFERRTDEDSVMSVCGDSVAFRDVFEFVAERTGAHVRIGDVYSKGIDIPEKLENHELFDAIVAHFSAARTPLGSAAGY